MQKANYHTHTHYSDGADAPEVVVKKALELGLETIGFSDHAPIPGFEENCNISLDQLDEYVRCILDLKEKYKDRIRVLLSLEIDYIPNIIHPAHEIFDQYPLDFTLGSVHYLGVLSDGKLFGFEASKEKIDRGLNEIFGGDVEKMVKEYYSRIREMVRISQPNIIGHLDRIKFINKHHQYFNEMAGWYQIEVKNTLEVIASSDSILEVNTKGIYSNGDLEPYPSSWIIRAARDRYIPVHLAADAHRADRLTGGFDYAAKILKNSGYDYVNYLKNAV